MRTLLLLLVATAAVATASTAQNAQPPAVIVAPVLEETVTERAEFNGRLEADRQIAVRARVGGPVTEIGFEAGDMVAEGDVLFEIDDAPFSVAVREAEGALRSAQALRDQAQLERDRQAELTERQTAAQAVLDAAEAALGNAEGNAIRAEAALERAKLNRSYATVTAPFAGRMGVPEVDIGALVGPETGALATLTQLDPIHAVFSVPTAAFRTFSARVDAGEASAEGAVSLTLADGSVHPGQGDLFFIASEVSAGTDSIELRARFDNPTGALRNGELVRVALTSSPPSPQLTVAQKAVQRDVQGAFVLVVGDDAAVELRRIDVDRTVGGRAVISSGLEVGERVITDGVNKVRPGVTVDAAEATGG